MAAVLDKVGVHHISSGVVNEVLSERMGRHGGEPISGKRQTPTGYKNSVCADKQNLNVFTFICPQNEVGCSGLRLLPL